MLPPSGLHFSRGTCSSRPQHALAIRPLACQTILLTILHYLRLLDLKNTKLSIRTHAHPRFRGRRLLFLMMLLLTVGVPNLVTILVDVRVVGGAWTIMTMAMTSVHGFYATLHGLLRRCLHIPHTIIPWLLSRPNLFPRCDPLHNLRLCPISSPVDTLSSSCPSGTTKVFQPGTRLVLSFPWPGRQF